MATESPDFPGHKSWCRNHASYGPDVEVCHLDLSTRALVIWFAQGWYRHGSNDAEPTLIVNPGNGGEGLRLEKPAQVKTIAAMIRKAGDAELADHLDQVATTFERILAGDAAAVRP